MTAASVATLEQRFPVFSLIGAADPARVLAECADSIRGIAGGKVSGELMCQLPKLEIIANSGVGVDSNDLATARERGIIITNTPDVLNDAVAELALALMLALSRAIPGADAFVRSGRWQEGLFPLGSELRGKKVGILGLGRIGKEIAARLTAMKMDVAYCGRSLQPDQPYRYFDDLEAMAADCDWLVVSAPANAGTRAIVSRGVMQALGPQGRLVNVARGSLVDEQAMIALLQTGALGAVALDVFEGEPAVAADLLALENVVLSPHQGSRTAETRESMDRLVVENLVAHFERRPAPHRVV